MRLAISVGSMLLILSSACGGEYGSTTAPVGSVGSVDVTVASTDTMTSAGDTREVTAVVRDGDGYVLGAPAVSWHSSNESIATVEGSGASAIVTAVDDGAAVISARSGGEEDTITITVRRRVASITLSSPDSVLVAGSTARLAVVGIDARGRPMSELSDVTYASSNPFSVLAAGDGLVTALYSSFSPFSAVVTASVTRDGATFSGTKRFAVTSAAPAAFDFLAVMLPEGVRPEPLFGVADGIVYLGVTNAGIDFTLLWSHVTERPIGAHLHGPAADAFDDVEGVLADFPVGDQFADHGVIRGTLTAENIRARDGRPAISLDSLVTLVQNGAVYADVHSAQHPAGEMRGAVLTRRAGM